MAKIIHGAYLIDDETGEILGFAEPDKAPFHPVDLQGIEWVLERISEAQGDRAALTARRTALAANLDRQIKAAEVREAFLLSRFGPDLEAFAKAETEGRKARYTDTAFGRLRFMKTQGSIAVADMEKALAFAEQHQPDAIKTTRSILVSAFKGQEDALDPAAFTVTPPRDVFKIETGVN